MEHLADKIVASARRGEIPRQFRVADIRPSFSGEYSKHHIDTVLANYEVNGYMVVTRGQRARFRRVARGLYEVFISFN